MNRLTVSKQAKKYLVNQYGVDFSIIDAERVPDSTGPLPVLLSTYHWELTAESCQFPNSTFKLYYPYNIALYQSNPGKDEREGEPVVSHKVTKVERPGSQGYNWGHISAP